MDGRSEKTALRTRLERFGDGHETLDWASGKVDYVSRLGLTAGDVPELIAVAQEWAQDKPWPQDENDPSGYAPIHAWRGLARLGAAEAVRPLLAMLDPLDALDDDWHLEEFPHVFAWIGPAGVPALRDYLAEASHAVYSRVAVANALQELAERHPRARDEVVKVLMEALSRFADTDEGLNAFVISYLLDLKATEAAEVIERAYAADRVDVSVVGNWNTVRKELGVAGLGLVPEELANQKWSPFPGLFAGGDDQDAPVDDVGEYLPEDLEEAPVAPLTTGRKVGRNEPCPCGSGKKYKKCCGR